MAENSKIEWCDDSINFWWGCVEVGPGCDHCYAKVLAQRWGFDVWGTDKPRRLMPNAFKHLDALQRKAKAEGRKRLVFLNSMSDLAEILHSGHPNAIDLDQIRERFFPNLVAGMYADLILIWLTKRVGNVPKVVPASFMQGDWPENLWLCPTVCNQAEAERDIPKLLAVPAKVRGLSCEPLLGPVDLQNLRYRDGFDSDSNPAMLDAFSNQVAHPLTCMEAWPPRPDDMCPEEWDGIHWVIAGGESGPQARPMHPDWARSLRDQCKAARVPFFFKQWGSYVYGYPGDPHLPDREPDHIFSDDCAAFRVGKKKAGRLLDGGTWDEMPEAAR